MQKEMIIDNIQTAISLSERLENITAEIACQTVSATSTAIQDEVEYAVYISADTVKSLKKLEKLIENSDIK